MYGLRNILNVGMKGTIGIIQNMAISGFVRHVGKQSKYHIGLKRINNK